jgi:cytochrome c oxidase subunit III
MNTNAASSELKLIQNSVAMTVALVSWGMLFATLFLGYFLVRFNAPSWPPVEIQAMPQAVPFVSLLVMFMSSITYWKFESTPERRKTFWVLTTLLGFAFLALQWTLWKQLAESGIFVTDGMVPSMVYAFTWLHAAHIVLGLIGLLWLGHLLWRSPAKLTDVKLINVGKFWHFLGVIWLLMYLMLFVL